MPLLNYTTKIAADKTAAEIERTLVKHGARAILRSYAEDAEINALLFRVLTPHGEMAIRLPIDADATLKVLERQYHGRQISRSFITREQAVRIAWRIVKDWVEAQMAILETEMVKMEQIFLPYMVTPEGKTLYEAMEEKRFYLNQGQTE